MKYLTVDGMLSGTGIRDSVAGGYLELNELGLQDELKCRIREWLLKYEDAHFRQFENEEENSTLDREGVAIAKAVGQQVAETKIEYFSSANMCKIEVA